MENKPELNVEEVVEETTKSKTKKSTKKDEIVKSESRSWKEVFKANYEGTSEEAKALKPFLKETFKGDVYIPWAVMERLTRMCDETAEFINVPNEFGGLVHSDMLGVHQKNIQNDKVVSDTESVMYSHFVKVKLVFMGKEFVEDYPIQDKDYSSARIYDQNLVNKALQRAKAKVAARGTGLGLRLYEGFDLQFDEKADKKPTLEPIEAPKEVKIEEKPAKTEQKVAKVEEKPAKVELTEEQKVMNIIDGGETEAFLNGERTFVTQDVKVEPAQVSEEVKADKIVLEAVKLIKATPADKMVPVLQKVNISIMKKYQFALSVEDSDQVLADKLSKFPNVEQFMKTLNNLLNS